MITGLTNGLTDYTFRVCATNANGSGALSIASASVIPASAPTAAPVLGTATPGPTTDAAPTATVSWAGVPTASSGGSVTTGYTVIFLDSGGAPVQSGNFGPAVRSLAFNSSTGPGPYTFKVLAFNSVGNGPLSAPSAPFTAK